MDQDVNDWQMPDVVDSSTIRGLLWWVAESLCSDLRIMSNFAPMVKKNGLWRTLNTRSLTHNDVQTILSALKESNSADMDLYSGSPSDFVYRLPPTEGKSYSYRVCATGVVPAAASTKGIDIVCRTIPGNPPLLSWHKLPRALEDAIFPDSGLILVVGKVGSGKTTLVASMLRELITTKYLNGITYEDPPEFDFSDIEGTKMPLGQSEIGTHINKFSEAGRNLLRRSPDFALFGEVRDKESISNMALAAEYGTAIYTTGHASSTSEAIPRLVRSYPMSERDAALSQLTAQVKVIIYQRLLVLPDGTRTAVRDYAVLTSNDRKNMVNMNITGVAEYVEDIQKKRGTDLESDLMRLLTESVIDRDQYNLEIKRSRF